MRHWILGLLLAAPLTVFAQDDDSDSDSHGRTEAGRALFMNDLIEGRDFLEPWGIGLDFYTMDQPYGIKTLEFILPGVGEIDPSDVDVQNKVQHYDLKLDAWITPFLNVFGLLGKMEADTTVDLSSITLPILPFPLPERTISFDGTVYGLGFTLAYGGERWFASWTNTWTDTDIDGDFESSVSTITSQPRVGLLHDKWRFWVGGMYLDADEKHRGTIDLEIPGLPPIPFNVEMETLNTWNYAVGAGYVFSSKAMLSLEIGFGDREHTLFNFNYRF